MRLKSILLLLVALGGGVTFWFFIPSPLPLEPLNHHPLPLPHPPGKDPFLAAQTHSIAATSETGPPAPSGTPIAEASEPVALPADPSVSPVAPRILGSAAEPGSIDPDSAEFPSPDEAILHQKAAQFAYVEYKGMIGGRGLAVFCIDPVSGRCESSSQGADFMGVRVQEVHPDHVLLGYGSAPPLRKPRVDLEVDYKPMDQLTPEEIRVRTVRYQELFGNRFDQGSRLYQELDRSSPPLSPSEAERLRAEQVYRETYGQLFERLQRGEPNADNQEYPRGAPTLDEKVQEYLETYWPGADPPGR